MKLENKIGIVGLGFVGSAIYYSFYPAIDRQLVLVDSDPSKGCTDTYEDLLTCEGIFVCVPSPQNTDGSCNTDILESVLEKLKDYSGVIISKVTAPPNVYQRLSKTYKNLVHSPEFLTAANADKDYLHGRFAIIGGEVLAYIREAERIIRLSQRGLNNVVHCSIGEAALAKYTINSFLATKVIFMNEMRNLATNNGMDWETIVNAISQDHRIGQSHMQVPGPDGNFGFGGMCFPKDTAALLSYAESLNCQLNVLDSAVKKNTILRLQESK